MRTPKHPHALFDALIAAKGLKHDRELAKYLDIDAASICKTRSSGRTVSDHIRLSIIRKFGWSLRRVDELAPPAEVKS